MPRFFRLTKFASFQRQLNLYGFRVITEKGDTYGFHYHKDFNRNSIESIKSIQRRRDLKISPNRPMKRNALSEGDLLDLLDPSYLLSDLEAMRGREGGQLSLRSASHDLTNFGRKLRQPALASFVTPQQFSENNFSMPNIYPGHLAQQGVQDLASGVLDQRKMASGPVAGGDLARSLCGPVAFRKDATNHSRDAESRVGHEMDIHNYLKNDPRVARSRSYSLGAYVNMWGMDELENAEREPRFNPHDMEYEPIPLEQEHTWTGEESSSLCKIFSMLPEENHEQSHMSHLDQNRTMVKAGVEGATKTDTSCPGDSHDSEEKALELSSSFFDS